MMFNQISGHPMAQSSWHIKLPITSLVIVALTAIPGMYALGIMLRALHIGFHSVLSCFTEKQLQFREMKSLWTSLTPRLMLRNIWPSRAVGLDVHAYGFVGGAIPNEE